ncbi:MAG: CRTAC1 family protein [Vicinamibacteria bacterium]|nr:CRTAC1 family protein [Vicinamibacteria bacterium]
MKSWTAAGAIILVAATAPGQAQDRPSGPITFTDIAGPAGLAAFKHSYGDHDLDNIVEATGVGPCLFDYDGDDDLDVYFPNGRWTKGLSDNRGRNLIGKLKNALYRNNGDGTFTDVTNRAGVAGKSAGYSASAADYDGDGDLDLYLCNYGPNELYRNNGDGTFTDVTAEAGIGDPLFSLSGVWLDYDGDGDLDLFVCNYLEYDEGKFRSFYAATGFPGPLSYNGQPDTLYRNNGDGTFTDVTKAAGVYFEQGRGMSATAADLNNDGLVDIYVANDAMENNYFENSGKGSFIDNGLLTGLAFGQNGQGVSSMGPAVGDIDRDGHLDILIPDMDYMSLLVWRDGIYEDHVDRSNIAVISGQYTGWGGVLFDFDNDGYLDVFIANGHPHHEYPENAVLARNNGKGVFVDVARHAGEYFGTKKWYSRGTAYADIDDDGDLDLLVMDLNGHPHLLRNDGGNTANHWLKFDVRRADGKLAAIGARVTVVVGGLKLIDDVSPVRGYLAQNDPRLHFGLGKAVKADLVEIRWPDGRTRRMKDVPSNQILKVTPDAR